MALSDELATAAARWLESAGGSIGTYHMTREGSQHQLMMVLEQDVETMDPGGSYDRDLIMTLPSNKIKTCQGDMIRFADENYRVDRIIDNPGLLTRMLVAEIP